MEFVSFDRNKAFSTLDNNQIFNNKTSNNSSIIRHQFFTNLMKIKHFLGFLKKNCRNICPTSEFIIQTFSCYSFKLKGLNNP